MREKKFRYTFKHVVTGNIEQKIYTLSQLEERTAKELSPCFNAEFGYKLIGRDDFTGLKDKYGTEIYEGDIVKTHNQNNVVEYEQGTFRIKGLHHDEYERTYVAISYYLIDSTIPTASHSRYDGITTSLGVIGSVYENQELMK